MNAALEKRLKRQLIGKPHRFLAVVPLGFEQTFVNELEFIRQQSHVVGDGKIEFTTKLTEAWKVVAYSRIANRVLMHIADFKAENFRELEKKAAEIPWELYLLDERYNVIPSNARDPVKVTNTLNIHVTCKHSRLYHSDAIAERLQKIISKTFSSLDPSTPVFHASAQDDKIAKPQSEATSPLKASETSDLIAHRSYLQHLYVTLIDDRCTIWLDLAGEELYKRGFERFVNDAPLKETIAAAMIFEALHMAKQQEGDTPQPRHLSSSVQQRNSFSSKKSLDPIDASHLQDDSCVNPLDDTSENLQDDIIAKSQSEHSERPHTSHLTALIDPMSGSGTFSLEAACIANNIIPGICRNFALMHQPAFKEATWKFLIRRETKDERRENGTPAAISRIITSDISPKAISIIKHNVECSPFASMTPTPINPQHRDFFSYTAKEIAEACGDTAPILVLNPPYGKRLDFDAPKLYTKIGKKLADLARELKALDKILTVAILAPKDDAREGSKYTCTANLLRECPALAPNKKSTAKLIETSHGGFSLNVLIAKI